MARDRVATTISAGARAPGEAKAGTSAEAIATVGRPRAKGRARDERAKGLAPAVRGRGHAMAANRIVTIAASAVATSRAGRKSSRLGRVNPRRQIPTRRLRRSGR